VNEALLYLYSLQTGCVFVVSIYVVYYSTINSKMLRCSCLGRGGGLVRIRRSTCVSHMQLSFRCHPSSFCPSKPLSYYESVIVHRSVCCSKSSNDDQSSSEEDVSVVPDETAEDRGEFKKKLTVGAIVAGCFLVGIAVQRGQG